MTDLEQTPIPLRKKDLIDFTRGYLLHPVGPVELRQKVAEAFPGHKPEVVMRVIGAKLYDMTGVKHPSNHAKPAELKRVQSELADALGIDKELL